MSADERFGVYIAGPMRGYPAYNFAAFEAAQERVLREWGDVDVFNPAWNDIERAVLTGTAKAYGWAWVGEYLLNNPSEFSLRDALTDDLTWICQHAGHLVLLQGWENSSGARTEYALAHAIGLRIWLLDSETGRFTEITDANPIDHEPDPCDAPGCDGCGSCVKFHEDGVYLDTHSRLIHGGWNPKAWSGDATYPPGAAQGLLDPLHGEVRTTSSTGGQKGTKPERYDLIPWEAMDEVARVYGFGAQKYAAHNWRRKYEWGKSIAALIRHITAFVRGKTYDEETGLHHLAHAVFHCLALIVWTAEDGEGSIFDDRFRPDMFNSDPLPETEGQSQVFILRDGAGDWWVARGGTYSGEDGLWTCVTSCDQPYEYQSTYRNWTLDRVARDVSIDPEPYW